MTAIVVVAGERSRWAVVCAICAKGALRVVVGVRSMLARSKAIEEHVLRGARKALKKRLAAAPPVGALTEEEASGIFGNVFTPRRCVSVFGRQTCEGRATPPEVHCAECLEMHAASVGKAGQ